MSFLSFIPVIGKALEKGLGIVDDLVEDKDKANEIKASIQKQVLVQNHNELVKELDAQMKIILAEAKGGFLQRNWRPILMLTIVAIIANNYVVAPYVELFFPGKSIMLELPGGLWALLNVGVGGYVAGRSAEKIFKKE
jgi:hypothetical protein